MKKLIKYLLYVFVIISSLFVWCNVAYAKSFRTDGELLCTDKNGNLVACCKPEEGCFYWGSYKKVDNNGNNAYCSDQPRTFFQVDGNGNAITYKIDNGYEGANNCTYYANGQWHNNGDCSSIVGYIINEAESDMRYSSDARWFRAQVALWMYLGRYGYESIRIPNIGIANDWDNSNVSQYIPIAWEKYATIHNLGGTIRKDDVNFNFNYDTNDMNFYYKPSTGSCDNGFYRTKSFQVVNNESVEINVALQTNNANVDVCYINSKGITKCGKSFDSILLIPNKSIEVFLKSNVDETERVKFEAIASYTSGEVQQYDIYDSERYFPPENYFDEKGSGQGLLILKTSSKGIDRSIIHSSSKSLTFSKDEITRKKCADDSNEGNGTKNNPIGKVCADKSEVENDYIAEFSGCTCFGLDLGNNRYVSIVVGENAKFSFGKLTPNGTLYAGGGFGFSESGFITQYVAEVSWEYANEKNGVPYYYNGNNLKDNDARNIENEINEALKKRLKDKLSLNFYTRDSNDYLNKSMVIVPLELDVSNVQFNTRVYELNSNAMKMNEAYFSSDGRVSYNGKNDTYSIKGGNKYYVPMGYSENVFPFDISVSNLSIVEGIDFWYEAECDKEVEDLYKSLYYRSIDLENPFPKANNLTANVPENWRFWYCGTSRICNNLGNRNRLENTYQNYPDGPLYEIVLNSDKFKKINSITDYYTSWSNVNKDGVSSFVTDMDLFETYTNNKSYCPIGSFSEECDK